MRAHRYGEIAQIVVAACTGSQRLTEDIGQVVHIGASLDADGYIRALNRRQHGCGVRWPGSFQPLNIETGWADWASFTVDPDVGDILSAPHGVQIVDGRILVMLPPGVPIVEFKCQLAGALRHLRLQEVTIRADFLEARSEAMANLVVHPRYTPPRAAMHDFRGAVLVEDLFVLDPAEKGARLFWLVVAARAAAIEGGLSPRR